MPTTKTLPAAVDAAALLTIRDIMTAASLSKSEVFRRRRSDPNFPPKVVLSTRCVRYRQTDVVRWLASLGRGATR